MKSLSPQVQVKIALGALLVSAGTLLPARAQIPYATEPLNRFGKGEFYGIGQYLHSSDIFFNGPTGDVRLRMNDTGLGGFGFAYHFHDFFSVRGDFMFGSATFKGDLPLRFGGTAPATQDAFLQTGRLNLDYNIINRRLTPFVTAGIGYQYTETELNHPPPASGGWWDPWYGGSQGHDHGHAWQTDFTWNAGAGLRWNVTDHLFVKATAGATWLEYGGAKGITTQLEGIFSIGWTF
jgi:opacity protein-like surface antigen